MVCLDDGGGGRLVTDDYLHNYCPLNMYQLSFFLQSLLGQHVAKEQGTFEINQRL